MLRTIKEKILSPKKKSSQTWKAVIAVCPSFLKMQFFELKGLGHNVADRDLVSN